MDNAVYPRGIITTVPSPNLNLSDFIRSSAQDETDTSMLCHCHGLGKDGVRISRIDPDSLVTVTQNEEFKLQVVQHQLSKSYSVGQESQCTGQSSSSIIFQGQSPMADSSISSASPLCPAPLSRQFWKAGNYDDEHVSKAAVPKNTGYVHIHPKFLHSNATSHKWVLGAIAELVDNAVDQIIYGATFINIDKITNPSDGTPALLFQDDGGGMGPEALRRCMSFGFSDKKSTLAIGQYGNGFKTSSMRLGADAMVFSCHVDHRNEINITQSVGLVSYTFLTKMGYNRVVVPVVDYKFNSSSEKYEPLYLYSREHFMSNLSILLQWSPYSTEVELLKQFEDIGYHGTKIVIYNLWCGDDGSTELDLDSHPEDIRVAGHAIEIGTGPYAKSISREHIANQFHYSLRAYLSILYLKLPQCFMIILRGRVIEHYVIANDLKYPEFIVYKPQSGGVEEGTILTTIGFLKEAPHVNIHGFNVYHKNRLILPFYRVAPRTSQKGRGVVGVLEANIIEPTHNKQEFEKTSLFQKLEARLKDMTIEYWNTHFQYIGYRNPVQILQPSPVSSHSGPKGAPDQPAGVIKSSASIIGSAIGATASRNFHFQEDEYNQLKDGQGQSTANMNTILEQGVRMKRKEHDLSGPGQVKRRPEVGTRMVECNREQQDLNSSRIQINDWETSHLLEMNKKLRADCLEKEKVEEELNSKVLQLASELEEAQQEYGRLIAELRLLGLDEGIFLMGLESCTGAFSSAAFL
ncbi:Morc, S5 domain 2-like [Dillenia turbinata]|uniref:Morc, S5 domain 2-like n=1 Tax=Dillenia turbinata TaxID=194707 RepID=A0AAN8UWY2_9MAGN